MANLFTSQANRTGVLGVEQNELGAHTARSPGAPRRPAGAALEPAPLHCEPEPYHSDQVDKLDVRVSYANGIT